MTPLSALRILLTGLWSWALLGGAAYFLWEWADGKDQVVSVTAADRQPFNDDPDVAEQPELIRRDRHGWPYLAAGIALLACSFGGGLPFIRLLNRADPTDPTAERDGDVQTIERPDGSKLRVETYGRENGPTLIFTHGWSLDCTAWHYAKRQLSNSYRLVVWDLPGLGKSEGPQNRDYRLEKMAHDLDAVISAAAAGPVILVGHSIGGMIIQTYCRLFPDKIAERISGIVLLHTTYTNPIRTMWGAPLLRLIEKPIIVPMNYLLIGLAPLYYISNWMSYWNGSLHTVSRFTSFAGNQTWGQLDYSAKLSAKAWPGVIARGNLAMLKFDAESVLPHIEIPTLIIGGQYDRVTKPVASDRMDQLLPQSVETLVPAGHLGIWEQHTRVGGMISEFAMKVSMASERNVAATEPERPVHHST